MGRPQLYTQSQYDLFEVVSALQKEIRRGREEGAMYWALELLPRFEKYLWRRLLIIANEDIGLASIETVQFVTSQCQSWLEMTRLGGKGPWLRLVVSNTILAMCRAPKSRLGDHFQCVVHKQHNDRSREIPDYALDKHTTRGKRMGRGMQNFLEVSAQLHPEAQELHDPYREEAAMIWLADNPSPSRQFPLSDDGSEDNGQLSMGM